MYSLYYCYILDSFTTKNNNNDENNNVIFINVTS